MAVTSQQNTQHRLKHRRHTMNEITTVQRTEIVGTSLINEAMTERWLTFLDATPKTVQTYTRSISQFVRWCEGKGISRPTADDIRAYRDELAQDHKASTVNAYLMAVKQLYKWLEEEGISKNVAKNVKAVKLDSDTFKKDYLTTGQCKSLISGIDRTTLQGKRDYAICSLMLTTGMRDIEIQRANIEDLVTLGDFTALMYQGKGRHEKAKYKKIAPVVEDAVRDYLKARGKADATEPLFISTANRNYGERMTTRSISRIVKTRLVNVGLDSDRLTAHSLRHTAGTQNLLNGGSLEETQQLLDHRDINTTLIYVHALERANSQAEQRIADAIFG